jgi:hypothetical protein
MAHRINNRLPAWHRRVIYALTFALVLSGAIWLIVAYLLAPASEATPAPHPWATAMLTAHGVVAYAALVAYALVGHAHLRTGWRVPALRSAAFVLCAAVVFLAVTGLGFYYIATESALPLLRWSHVAAGVILPCCLALHIVRGRRVTGRA